MEHRNPGNETCKKKQKNSRPIPHCVPLFLLRWTWSLTTSRLSLPSVCCHSQEQALVSAVAGLETDGPLAMADAAMPDAPAAPEAAPGAGVEGGAHVPDEKEEEEEEEDEEAEEEAGAAGRLDGALSELLDLERALTSNPWSGAAHGAVVARLRALRLTARLAAARAAWAARLLLPETAWAEWLDDEEAAGCEPGRIRPRIRSRRTGRETD